VQKPRRTQQASFRGPTEQNGDREYDPTTSYSAEYGSSAEYHRPTPWSTRLSWLYSAVFRFDASSLHTS